jgi:acyl-CoA thioesterase I
MIQGVGGWAMQRAAVVSRPAWVDLIAGSGPDRKSPVELVATAASVVTRSPYAVAAGLRGGRFEQWTDGVGTIRDDCKAFARFWIENNEEVLAAPGAGPLWVVLGDSTAQGIGAPSPHGGYVGQALQELRERTGQPWRALNLSVSGALIRDVLTEQLPQLLAMTSRLAPGLVTCGIGANDILFSAPGKLFRDLRAVLGGVPEGTVMLDLPLARGFWGILGWCSVPYITRINRIIRQEAGERGLRVASVSTQFTPPWPGKFSVDSFHPSQAGYQDWARALLAAMPLPGVVIPASAAAAQQDGDSGELA